MMGNDAVDGIFLLAARDIFDILETTGCNLKVLSTSCGMYMPQCVSRLSSA